MPTTAGDRCGHWNAKRRPLLGKLCVAAAGELAELWPVRQFQHAGATKEGYRNVHAA